MKDSPPGDESLGYHHRQITLDQWCSKKGETLSGMAGEETWLMSIIAQRSVAAAGTLAFH